MIFKDGLFFKFASNGHLQRRNCIKKLASKPHDKKVHVFYPPTEQWGLEMEQNVITTGNQYIIIIISFCLN